MTLTQRADRAASEMRECQRLHLVTAPKRREAILMRALELLRFNQKNGYRYKQVSINALRRGM